MLRGLVDGELDNVSFLLDGIIPKWSHWIIVGTVAMFGVAVCSVQFSVLPLSLGHNVEIHTGIEGVLMFGDENVCTSHIQTCNGHFKRLRTLICKDVQFIVL